ncbi:MAG: gamma-D-glutamyl-meso-diaminopimelate peptidase [Clostridia bacterium]|nr:gamma-D-glutamyl-meso-diaminopimelate peptidase [Clostridia bacterium]
MPFSASLYAHPFDEKHLKAYTETLCSTYSGISLHTLTRSLCGRAIPYLAFGEGKRKVLYVGTHHGMEWITGLFLLHFVKTVFENDHFLGASIEKLLARFRFFVIPSLNVDGAELQIHGANPASPLYERQMRMQPSGDFSAWQANARGVDLNHNYNADFYAYKAYEKSAGIVGPAASRYGGLYPESEPEVAGLCSLVRMIRPTVILTLHTQGEEVFYGASYATPRIKEIGRSIASLIDYKLSEPQGSAAFSGMTDWAVKCGIPAYTLECGKGKNPLPLSEGEVIFARIRPALFAAPDRAL